VEKTNYKLREATEDDAQAIRDLVRSARINPTGLDWERFVLAESAREGVIGCAQIKPHRDGSQELASLVVASEWRGQGVARMIIERLLRDHPGEMYLMCRSSLGPLYKKFGFREVEQDEMPKYFRLIKRLSRVVEVLQREGETLLVMKREAQ